LLPAQLSPTTFAPWILWEKVLAFREAGARDQQQRPELSEFVSFSFPWFLLFLGMVWIFIFIFATLLLF
jgi:hypothetical protein